MGKFEEIKRIKDKETLKGFVRENERLLKMILLPAIVAMAVIIFWIFGSSGSSIEIEVEIEGDGSGSGYYDDETDLDNDWLYDEDLGALGSIYVDIGGEVKYPGVYEVEVGTRLFQVINAAGGMTDSADRDSINQAEIVSDGQKIIVGSTDESSPYYQGTGNTGGSNSSSSSGTNNGAVTDSDIGYIVNINLADSTQLQLIPGVGPVTASKIIEYRETYGSFKTTADIKNISGIGDKTYENLKDYICV